MLSLGLQYQNEATPSDDSSKNVAEVIALRHGATAPSRTIRAEEGVGQRQDEPCETTIKRIKLPSRRGQRGIQGGSWV